MTYFICLISLITGLGFWHGFRSVKRLENDIRKLKKIVDDRKKHRLYT